MSNRLQLILAACAAISVSASGANPAPDPSDLELSEPPIVVSASRLGQSDQNVRIFDQEYFDGRQAHWSADAFKGVESYSLSQQGSRGALTQARVRGAEANHLMVLIDGVKANDPATGADFNFGHLDLIGASRVDVLNGPQSSIWGSSALAGVLYIDNTPIADRTRLDISGGSHSTVKVQGEAARVNDRGYFSVAGSHLDTDGTNISSEGQEDDGFTNSTIHATGGYQTDGFQVRSSLRWNRADNDFDASNGQVQVDADRSTESERWLGMLDLAYVGHDVWTPQLIFAATASEHENFADGELGLANEGRRYTTTFSNNLELAPRQAANVSLEHERLEFEQRGEDSFFGNPNQQQDLSTTSLAGEYQFRGGSFLLSASVRHDWNDEYDDVTTFRVGGAVDVDQVRLLASAGTGSRAPTFTERFGFTPDTFLGNPALRPETSTSFEVGMTFQGLAVTVFDSTLDDEINGFAFDGDLGVFTAVNRIGESDRRGVEISYDRRFGNAIVGLVYSYLDATEEGVREIRRPKHQGRVHVAAQVTKRLLLNAGASYTGKQLDNDFSTFPFTVVTLDDYVLVHAGASWRAASRIELYGQVENLFDAEYQDVLGFQNPGLTAIAGVRATF